MSRAYQYHGFDIEVLVEADFCLKPGRTVSEDVRYAAIVKICVAGIPISSTRMERGHGAQFSGEADALMGGYSAGQRIIDNLLCRSSR